MKCPHCQNEMELLENKAHEDYKAYGTPTNVITACCGKGIKVSAVKTYNWKYEKVALPILPDGTQWDDWGNEIPVDTPSKSYYWVCDGMAFDDEVSAKYHQTNTEGNPRIVFVEEKFNEL